MTVYFKKSQVPNCAAATHDPLHGVAKTHSTTLAQSSLELSNCVTTTDAHWLPSPAVVIVDSLERARSALFALPADCDYAEWFTIACAAKEAGLLFADFNEWSATGNNKYKGKTDCLNIWNSVKAGKQNGITKWRLLKLAQEAGWIDPNPGGDFGGPLPQEPTLQQQAVGKIGATAEKKASGNALEQRFASYELASKNHPYIQKKYGHSDGLRVVPNADASKINGYAIAGFLAVPCRALDGTLLTIQYIGADGTKLNAPGETFADGMFLDRVIMPTGRVYVVEGIGKAWAVRDADYDAAAAVSFGIGRFSTVAKTLRAAYPTVQIVLVPDRGQEHQAQKFAAEVGATWVELPHDKTDNYGVDDFKLEHGAVALRKLLQSAKTPESGEGYDHLIDWSDTGNANLFAKMTAGDLRFIPEQGKWLHWDGTSWQMDDDGVMAQKHALRVAEHYRKKAASFRSQCTDAPNDDDRKRLEKLADSHNRWATQCRNKPRLRAMLDIAGRFQHVALPIKSLDANPMLLGVANGVVDLRTGTLRAAAREDFVTKRSPVPFDPTATAPKWARFVEEITGTPIPPQCDKKGDVIEGTVGQFKPRPALANYLRQALGYALTGLTEQHKLFVCVGAGSNGKNVLLDVVRWVLGDYGISLPSTMLLDTKNADDAEKASPNSARLAGMRCAIGSENKEGQKFAVATIKRHTGDSTMTARFLHGNPFEFQISHKLWLMTNAVPAIDHLDGAIKGRLHFIPFDRQWNRPGEVGRNPLLPDGDERLLNDLKKEGPGILAWLVAGAVEYEKGGLTPPTEVANMTRAYFAEQDVLGKWLEHYERCDPKDGTPAKLLLEALLAWGADEGVEGGKYNATSFRKALASRHIGKHKTKQGILYGLRLLPDAVSNKGIDQLDNSGVL